MRNIQRVLSVLKILLVVALAHGLSVRSRCVVQHLDGCSSDRSAPVVQVDDKLAAEYDESVASPLSLEEYECLARSKERFEECANQQHQQIMATFTPTGASSVFPADEIVEEAIGLLDSSRRSPAAGIPLLLFPQCKIDGFWSNHGLVLKYVYVARMLVKAGVEFRFVVPDLYFWEQPAGVHDQISNQSFEAVYDLEHFAQFLGAQVVSQGALDAETGRMYTHVFFVTTKATKEDEVLINERGDLFERCAGPEDLQGVAEILPSAEEISFSFNSRDFIAELAELLTRKTHQRPLFVVHGVPKSIVHEAAASVDARPYANSNVTSVLNVLHNNSVPALKLSATVRDAALFIRSLWNISAADSWVHLHIRRGVTPNLPGWQLGQMSEAEIEFALKRAFHEVPHCLSTQAPGYPPHATVVVSSIKALSDAILIQTLYPHVQVRVFDSVLWGALSAQGIKGWTGAQILRDLVEVQMMRDAGVFIGSTSSMSREESTWRALTRGRDKDCNINGQPCFGRHPDYHKLGGTQRLSCLNS